MKHRVISLGRLLMYAGMVGLLGACGTFSSDRESQLEVPQVVGPPAELGPKWPFDDLPSISFASSRTSLEPAARSRVREIARVINRPEVRDLAVTVAGFSDSVGSEKLNLRLSRDRAEAVAQELIFNGVRPERLEVKAYGETRPLAPDVNPDGSPNPEAGAMNRRVEISLDNLASVSPQLSG